jgi:hypothetical protein
MQKITGDTFQQGQHICAIYDTEEEQLAVAAAYVVDGLVKHERCLYVADSHARLDEFRHRLAAAGIDVAAAESSAALLLLTKAQAHLFNGRFDSERMLRMLNEAVEAALNDGFGGLRTCGDMSWLLDDAPGTHHVVEYEALLNQFFRHVRGLGMCQYDRRRVPEAMLEQAGIRAHSTVVIGAAHKANPFFDPASLADRSTNTPSLDVKLDHLRKNRH